VTFYGMRSNLINRPPELTGKEPIPDLQFLIRAASIMTASRKGSRHVARARPLMPRPNALR
jgi:hypothetical protein